MSNKLYIGNVSFNTGESELRTLFGGAGEIKTITIPTDRMNNRPRGFAFVEMNTLEEAHKAIEMYNGQQLDGRTIQVSEARPAERHPSSLGQKPTGSRF